MEAKLKDEQLQKIYQINIKSFFNGECDSLIAKSKWNNVNQMKVRIT
jgi:hypothetical protein